MKDLKLLELERRKVEKELINLANKLLREVKKPVKTNGNERRGGPDLGVMKVTSDRISEIVNFLSR